jgi:mRNA interferase MazF
VWIDFTPQTGHEQAGTRSALVISPRDYNRRVGLALLCPVTTSIKGYPFEVALPAGLKLQGVVLADQVKSLDWRARRARYADQVAGHVLQQVTARVLVLVDPDEDR